MHPTTGQQLTRCPWLVELPAQKWGCSIYHDRPEDCRHYPVDIPQMVKDQCEMLELKDLSDQVKAQKRLDHLMTESRPPRG